jgi:uncharacterized membrane protein YphA (DoxX/SURF4 family)
MQASSVSVSPALNRTLWVLQVLLAVIFLFAGVVKLVIPIDQLTKQTPMLPGPFLRFVAVLEVLGAVGLILPRLLKIRPGLTPLAAVGLVGIMIGAVVVTAMTGGVAQALLPGIVGIVLVFVAYGRWRLAP